jgi:DNA-binding transcriptional MerR regulator
MLRHYDSCGLLVPAKIDPVTGYRLYSAAQIADATRITALRDMGFGVEEIGGLLSRSNERDTDAADAALLAQALNRKRDELQERISQEMNRLEQIAAYEARLRKEKTIMVFNIELKDLPAVDVLSLRRVIPRYDQEYLLWEDMRDFVQKHKVDCAIGGYSIYHDEGFVETDTDVEIAVPVEAMDTVAAEDAARGFSYRRLEALPTAATVRFSGAHEGGYAAAMERLAQWTESEGYVFDGLVRGLVISAGSSPDPDCNSTDDFLTEVQVPVRKA